MTPAASSSGSSVVDPAHHHGRQAQRQLVEQQHAGVGHQRPADRHGLLLAAGQLRGALPAALGASSRTARRRARMVHGPGRACVRRRPAGSPRRSATGRAAGPRAPVTMPGRDPPLGAQPRRRRRRRSVIGPDAAALSPAMVRSRVDLPAPLAPMMACTSPAPTRQADTRSARAAGRGARSGHGPRAAASRCRRGGTGRSRLGTPVTALRPGPPASASEVVASVPRNTSRTAGSASTSAGAPSPTMRPPARQSRRSTVGGQRAHDVLDPDDGHALAADGPHDLHELGHLGVGQAARHLVQQQQPRDWWPAPWPAPAACAGAGRAARPGWLASAASPVCSSMAAARA